METQQVNSVETQKPDTTGGSTDAQKASAADAKKAAYEAMAKKRTWLPVSALVPVVLTLIWGIPVFSTVGPIFLLQSISARMIWIFLSPMAFCATYVGTCVLLSLPFQAAIVPGKFPRDVGHFVYGPRRLYGLTWGAVFYFSPVYYVFMSVPFLRTFLLRGFGYRGSTDVNFAPDAWIRDLPVMKIGKGVYVANKATVGTNMCLSDGTILVDKVTFLDGAMVGHMAKIAPGSELQQYAEVGVDGAVGIRTRIGSGSRVGPMALVNHGAQLGSQVEVGTKSYVGLKARIESGIKLPSGSNIPEGAVISTQEDVNAYITSESHSLHTQLNALVEVYQAGVSSGAMRGEGAIKAIRPRAG